MKYSFKELEASETTRHNEVTLNEAQEIAGIGSFVWDLRTDSLDWSRYMFEIAGLDPDSFHGNLRETIDNMIHPEDLDRVHEEVSAMVREKRTWPMEFRLVRPDGEIRWLRSGSRFVFDEQGMPIRCTGVHHDITDRKIAQDRLSQSQEELRRTLEATTDGIWEWNFKTGKLSFSPRYYTMLGYEPDAFPADYNNWLNLIHPDDRKRAVAVAEKYLGTKPDAYENEFRLRTKTGEYRWIRACARVVERDADGEAVYVIGNHEDITDRKLAQEEAASLEAQFEQNRRLDSLSTMAGGLAHDFNNALSAVRTNIELLKFKYPDHDEIMKCVRPVLDSAGRMGHLTNQLMAYAQGGKYQAKNLSVNRLVEDTLPAILHSDDLKIRIEKCFACHIPNIHADRTQMEMVLTSIIANAEEAMDGSGCIKISTGRTDIDESRAAKLPGIGAGTYVYLRIEDDGIGMESEIQEKVFEPFFSTKDQGRGLSMAATYGIVKNHGGWIAIESRPGKGTRVDVCLPATQVQETPAKPPTEELSFGKGTVLVIEDERPVMDAMKKALEVLGYSVLAADCGKKALQWIESEGDKIDLAILDIGLPDMPGDSVYRKIVERQSALRVLICSGYAPSKTTQAILDSGAHGFVQKPFSLAEFSSKVKAVFERE